jgi:hypothetical protein
MGVKSGSTCSSQKCTLRRLSNILVSVRPPVTSLPTTSGLLVHFLN